MSSSLIRLIGGAVAVVGLSGILEAQSASLALTAADYDEEEDGYLLDHPDAVSAVYLSHILFKLPEHPTEQQITEAKDKAAKAMDRVKAGESFADVGKQVSDDPKFVDGDKTLFNNDQDNIAGLGIGKDREYFETNEGKLIDAKDIKARYVRLYSRGSTHRDPLNRYTEVEVYGLPGK